VEEKGDPVFSRFLEEVDQEGAVIRIEKMTKEQASQKLAAREIQGIFVGGETPRLQVAGSGMAQSIMQSLLESYLNGKHIMEAVAETHPEKL